MSIAQKMYEKTQLNTEQTITADSMVAVGEGASKYEHYERFALIITELKAMEVKNLITITYSHPESQTGKKFIDVVKFIKLK